MKYFSFNFRRPGFPRLGLFIGLLVLAVGLLTVIRSTQATAIFTVNDLGDTSDATPGDGVCADAGSKCTLRAAIEEANALAGDDRIQFSVTGTIQLGSALPDLSTNISIEGPSAGQLTVRRNTGGNYRIFTVTSGPVVYIYDLTITNGNSTAEGDGVSNNGDLTLTRCTVSGNTSAFRGGGVYNQFGSLTITSSTISGNSATNSGGGVYANGTLEVTRSTISGNSAQNAGGIFNSTITAIIANSTVSGNSATSGDAGGLYVNTAISLTNSTISVNSASGNGGGIYVFSGPATLTSATVTQNHSDSDNNGGGDGGGVLVVFANGAVLHNTIVAANFKGSGTSAADDVRGAAVDSSSSFNLIGTGGAGGLTDGANSNQVGVADPGLGPLQANGGATQTHALLAGSPAIDKGEGSGSQSIDQRDFPRATDLNDSVYPNAAGGDG